MLRVFVPIFLPLASLFERLLLHIVNTLSVEPSYKLTYKVNKRCLSKTLLSATAIVIHY